MCMCINSSASIVVSFSSIFSAMIKREEGREREKRENASRVRRARSRESER